MKPDHKGIERALIKGKKRLFFGEYHFVVVSFQLLGENHLHNHLILFKWRFIKRVCVWRGGIGVSQYVQQNGTFQRTAEKNGQKERRKYLFHG